jgi:hypothetical protein
MDAIGQFPRFAVQISGVEFMAAKVTWEFGPVTPQIGMTPAYGHPFFAARGGTITG